MNNLFVSSIVSERVKLKPHELRRGYENTILDKLREAHEAKCTKNGYIRRGSIRLFKVSAGRVETNSLNGSVYFTVLFRCETCTPVKGDIVTATVRNTNRFGVMLTVGVSDADSGNMPINAQNRKKPYIPVVLSIVVPKAGTSQSVLPKIDLNSVKIGDKLIIELLGVKYELNDPRIDVLGNAIGFPMSFTDAKDPGTQGNASLSALFTSNAVSPSGDISMRRKNMESKNNDYKTGASGEDGEEVLYIEDEDIVLPTDRQDDAENAGDDEEGLLIEDEGEESIIDESILEVPDKRGRKTNKTAKQAKQVNKRKGMPDDDEDEDDEDVGADPEEEEEDEDDGVEADVDAEYPVREGEGDGDGEDVDDEDTEADVEFRADEDDDEDYGVDDEGGDERSRLITADRRDKQKGKMSTKDIKSAAPHNNKETMNSGGRDTDDALNINKDVDLGEIGASSSSSVQSKGKRKARPPVSSKKASSNSKPKSKGVASDNRSGKEDDEGTDKEGEEVSMKISPPLSPVDMNAKDKNIDGNDVTSPAQISSKPKGGKRKATNKKEKEK